VTGSSQRCMVLAVCRSCAGRCSEVCHRFDRCRRSSERGYRSGKPLDDADVKSAIDAGEKRPPQRPRPSADPPSGTEPVIRVMAEGDDRILVEGSGRQYVRPGARPGRRLNASHII